MKPISRRSYVKAAAVGGTLGLAGCTGDGSNGGGDGGGGGELRVAYHFPEDHYTPQGSIKPYLERIEENADGVTFNTFPSGQLGGATEYLSQVRDGSIDMAFILPVFHDDVMPLSSVGNLPYEETDLGVLASAFQDMADYLYEEELQDIGVRQLYATHAGTYDLFSVEEPIDTAAKWEGKTFRSSGWVQNQVCDAFGAAAEAIGPTEMYDALERGTVDGMIWPVTSVPPYSLQEVADYWVAGDEVNLAGNTMNMYINDDRFQALSEENQQVFLDAGDWVVPKGSETTKQAREDATETTLDAGVERAEIQDIDEWNDRLSGIIDQWVELDQEKHSEVLERYKSKIEENQ